MAGFLLAVLREGVLGSLPPGCWDCCCADVGQLFSLGGRAENPYPTVSLRAAVRPGVIPRRLSPYSRVSIPRRQQYLIRGCWTGIEGHGGFEGHVPISFGFGRN